MQSVYICILFHGDLRVSGAAMKVFFFPRPPIALNVPNDHLLAATRIKSRFHPSLPATGWLSCYILHVLKA